MWRQHWRRQRGRRGASRELQASHPPHWLCWVYLLRTTNQRSPAGGLRRVRCDVWDVPEDSGEKSNGDVTMDDQLAAWLSTARPAKLELIEELVKVRAELETRTREQAAILTAARAEERESCAEVADAHCNSSPTDSKDYAWHECAVSIGVVIRARSAGR